MLPDKSIASLVKFYYSWKKNSRTRSSAERHEKQRNKNDTSENGSENGSPNDSDIDDKVSVYAAHFPFKISMTH